MKPTKIIIDEKLFAHINNDPFLSGSVGLQGNRFATTIGFLNQYLRLIQERTPEQKIPSSVKELQKSSDKLVEYEALIEEMNLKIRVHKTVPNLRVLADKIHGDIKALKASDYLLVPGGWSTRRGSHAIIYRYSLDEEGNLLFSINNSGSGLQFHEKKSDLEKELYNPELSYKIPKEQIGNPFLSQVIERLLEAQVPGAHRLEEIKPEYLYQEIFPQLSHVDGKIFQSTTVPEAHWYTGGQISGTCTQHSLHQMLKSRFATVDEYRRFIYNFKMYAISEYLNQAGVLEDPKQHDLIRDAIRHNLRLLNLDQSANPAVNLFSVDEKEQGHAILLSFLSRLSPLKQFPAKAAENVFNTPSTTYKVRRIYPIEKVSEGEAEMPGDNLQMPVVLGQDLDVLKYMDQVLKRCNELIHDKGFALFEQLSSFFLTLPLPKDNIAKPLLAAYASLNSDDKVIDFFVKMNELQTLYFDTCRRMNGAQGGLLPSMYLVKMSAFTVIAHVNENHAPGFHQTIASVLNKLSPGSPDQAWIANNNPELDARYKHICELYKFTNYPYRTNTELLYERVPYYASLLNKKPSLIKFLESEYDKKYGSEKTILHQMLVKEGYKALYYFTEEIEALKKNFLFNGLIKKFTLQLEMEKAYIYGCRCYSDPVVGWFSDPVVGWYREISAIKIGLKFGALSVTMSPAVSNQGNLVIVQRLMRNKYNGVSGKPAAYALSRDLDPLYSTNLKRTDNHTQLFPGIYANKTLGALSIHGDVLTSQEKSLLSCREINSTDLEDRELFHLRRDAASQIRLTLDYFNSHLEKCIKTDLQQYIEANFFQPGLLIDELNIARYASFLNQFDSFISNGLAFYDKKGQLSQASLFFIRLAYQVNQYAALQDPRRLSGRLETFYQQVQHFLDLSDDESIKISLHRYRFLAALAQMKLDPDNTAHLDAAILSYFQLQVAQNPFEPLDLDTQFQLQGAKHDWMRCLDKHKHVIRVEHVQAVLEHLRIPIIAPSSVLGEYPIYTVTGNDKVIYTVNMERGLCFKDKMAYTITPLHILGHPVMRQLGLNGLYSCFVSADGRTFLIDNPQLMMRFIKKGVYYVVQKKWKDEAGELSWFQLSALSEAQRNGLQVDKLDTLYESLKLAETVTERDSLLWVHCAKEELLITDARHQPWYRGKRIPASIWDHTTDSNWQFTDVQKKALLCTQDTWIHEKLSVIESPEFITVVKKDRDYIATLARYGLQCSIDDQSRAIHFDWEGQQYRLNASIVLAGSEGIQYLGFSNDKHAVVILPVQQFIRTKARDEQSAYYRLKQDTQAQIPRELIKKIIESDQTQLWQYTDTEQHLVLKINEKRELVPQNSAQALYLCYLYLGSNQPEKAWAVLEECDKRLGGLIGTYDEIRYLSWIIKSLPCELEDDDAKAVIANPSHIASKLKALALLAGFSRQDKSILFPEPTEDECNVNGQYQRYTINAVKAFYSNVNTDIYQLYSKMQKMRREMPVDFTLSDVACKQLLDFYHDHLPSKDNQPKAVGAMGYEWVRLHLLKLRQEHIHLEVKEQMGVVSSYDKQRKNDIESYIKKHEGIAKVQSNLEYIAIDLSLPASTIKTHLLSYVARAEIFAFKPFTYLPTCKVQEAALIDALSLSICDDTFIENFKTYLSIAMTKDSPHRPALLHYCKATLIASRHVALADQSSNIPLLCNVLYRVYFSDCKLPDWANNYFDVIEYARGIEIESIYVPQLVDTSIELLMSAQNLWESIPAMPQHVIPEIIKDTLILKSFHVSLQESQPSLHLESMMSNWRKESTNYRTGGSLIKELTPDEDYVGKIKHESLGRLKSMATTFFNDRIIQELSLETKKSLSTLTQAQEQLAKTILKLAQNGPEDPILKQRWEIDILAGKRKPLGMSQLLTLYFHQDTTRYKTETGLSDTAIKRLHTLLINYIDQGLRAQQYQRVQMQLERLNQATESDKARAKYLLAQALFAENLVDVVHEPALSLFQWYENTLLRPQQKEALGRLLTRTEEGNYAQVIEKVIMGGGKSKVILPTLVQEKAKGDNLVIVVVPAALLHTNFTDFKATSSALYNQVAYKFEFSRESDCSARHLEQIYHDLTQDVIANNNYLVTTKDALLSLKLKYIDLLKMQPVIEEAPSKKSKKILSEWENQVMWADRLVSLFKNRGDMIIDEVHQELEYNNQLNFTMGEPGMIPKFILSASVDLYQFLEYLKKDNKITLGRTVSDNEAFKSKLAFELINHEKSPLKTFVEQIDGPGSLAAKELLDYLQDNGKIDETPRCVLEASPEDQDKIAFFMREISFFVPNTLARNYGEHYGPSKSMKQSPQTRALAIPYKGNNTPKERSRFQAYIETVNYTIQSLLSSGLSKDLLCYVLDEWQVGAKKESFKEGAVVDLDDTETAYLFSTLTKGLGIPFSLLDLKNEAQVSQLHDHLKCSKPFIYEVLKTHVLKHIGTDTEILKANSYDLVKMTRSCQGITGTPDNASTYDPSLHYDSEAVKGENGLIYSSIAEKGTGIRGIDFHNTEQFIAGLLDSYKLSNQIRAIIDISATFKGIDNKVVALALTDYFYQEHLRFKDPEPLQYVLYFNEKEQLTAIRIGEDSASQSPIVIGSSDPDVIAARLNCSPGACFSFYDQLRTTGTDIRQAEQARGLVLIDHETPWNRFLQGAMRMRGLIDGEQRIDIILPAQLKRQSLEELKISMENNEKHRLTQANFVTAEPKMRSLISDDLMRRILCITGDDAAAKKAQLLTVFERYFVEKSLRDDDPGAFFQKYGGLTHERNTDDLLKSLHTQLMHDWRTLLHCAKQDPNDSEVSAMSNQLRDIVEATCKPGVCNPKQKTGLEAGGHVDLQNEVKVEVEVQKEIAREMFDPLRKEAEYIRWYTDLERITNKDQLDFKTLTSICASTGAAFSPQFSDNIRASKNFYQSYEGQKKYIGMFLKPVHALLCQSIKGELSYTILTQQESQELQNWVNQQPIDTCWISTTQHTELAGKIPDSVRQSADYLEVIEQLRYFNGELSLMFKQDATHVWLDKQSKEKMDFFEQYLSVCRETPTAHIHQLRTVFSTNKKVYEFISQTPTIDRSRFDWKSRFPDCIDSDFDDYKKVAKVFYDLSTHWDSENFEREEWDCPLNAWFYIKQYVEKINELKKLLQTVETYFKSSPRPTSIIKKADSMSANEADFALLTQLLTGIPSLKSNKAILNTLAEARFIPFISNKQITWILQEPSLNLKEWLAEVLENRPLTHTELALAFQYHNMPELYERFIQKASDSKCLFAIAQGLIFSESPYDSALLSDIANDLKADDAVWGQVVSKMTDVSEISKVVNFRGAGRETYIGALKNEKTPLELVRMIAQTSSDEALLERCVRHREADDTVFLEYLAKILSKDSLVLTLIAEKTSDKEMLKILLSTFPNDDLLVKIAQNKASDREMLREIINEKASAQILKAAMENPNADDDFLALVVQKATDIDQIKEALLKSFAAKETYAAAMENTNADDAVLALVVQKATDTDEIKQALLKASAGEQTWKKAIERCSLNPGIFSSVVLQSPNEFILDQCIEHESADDAFFNAYLCKALTPKSATLSLIAEKSKNRVILTNLLKKELDDVSLHKLVKNQNIDDKILSALIISMKDKPLDFKRLASGVFASEFKHYKIDPLLCASINKLRLKGLKFLKASEKNSEKYDAASKALFSLYVLLTNATKVYAKNPDTHQKYKDTVESSIQQHMKVLETHRGIKGILSDILKWVLTRFSSKRFEKFKLNTGTKSIVEDFEKNMPKPPK